MRIITKKQEEIENEKRREIEERKLRFMGKVVTEEVLRRVGWKDQTGPDLGAFIKRASNEISYSDNVVL